MTTHAVSDAEAHIRAAVAAIVDAAAAVARARGQVPTAPPKHELVGLERMVRLLVDRLAGKLL